MAGIFSRVMDTFRRGEKETLIRQSGSTADSCMEKVRSGQSYLYKRCGMESELIELRLKEKVSGSFLSQALNIAGRRYPYINTRLVELDGDFYIVQNPNSIIARRSRNLKPLGSMECGGHLVDITYYGCSVYFAFHHALCDGRGIKPYIETVVYYYCRLKYNIINPPSGVRLAGDPMLPGETDDPFAKPYPYDESKQFSPVSRDALHIPENRKNSGATDYRYEVRIPRQDYLDACRRNGATPVTLLSLLMSRGIAELYPDCDKPVNANIASDMRAQLDMPNTYKNCVRTLILPYTRELAAKPLGEQAAWLRNMLDSQRDRDLCRRNANSFIGLSDKLDERGSYAEKQEIMGFFEDMSLDTYVVSYLGQFNFGEGERYVEEAHLYNSGTAGLGINMICSGEYFTLDFKQSFESGKYVETFCSGLKSLGVSCEASGCIPFTTPHDSVIKRS